MYCNIFYPPYPIFNTGASQPDSNTDTEDLTESCYATFINVIMSTLAKVLLQSLNNKKESTIRWENNNQPGTPWMNQSAQSD